MKMNIPIYQVDAFVKEAFSGNPAAVCPLDNWLPDEIMQSIAEENNLAETAFFVKEKEGYRIRWFTPSTEVKLCGHATLAAGYVLFNIIGVDMDIIEFESLSGPISVLKTDDLYTLNFPIDQLMPSSCPIEFRESLGHSPVKTFKGESDYLLIYENQSIVESFNPDFNTLSKVDCRGCIVSAPGHDFDVVCRGFFPQSGIDEDPATGSAQTTLAAYWPEQLGKTEYSACQLSDRKGFFRTSVKDDRVFISGECRLYLKGEILV
jgi:PhzF family phenazine biosynthesis protein